MNRLRKCASNHSHPQGEDGSSASPGTDEQGSKWKKSRRRQDHPAKGRQYPNSSLFTLASGSGGHGTSPAGPLFSMAIALTRPLGFIAVHCPGSNRPAFGPPSHPPAPPSHTPHPRAVLIVSNLSVSAGNLREPESRNGASRRVAASASGPETGLCASVATARARATSPPGRRVKAPQRSVPQTVPPHAPPPLPPASFWFTNVAFSP